MMRLVALRSIGHIVYHESEVGLSLAINALGIKLKLEPEHSSSMLSSQQKLRQVIDCT